MGFLQEVSRQREKQAAHPRTASGPVDQPLRRSAKASFLAAVLLVGFLGFFTWRGTRLAAEEADWVTHTHDVMRVLETTMRDVLDAVAGSRGYAATGQEQFLAPFEMGRTALHQDLQTLQRLTSDNPERQEQVRGLQPQMAAAMELAKRVVDLRRRTGITPPVEEFVEGKSYVDAVRASIAEMQADEAELLSERSARQRKARRSTNSIVAASTLVGVGLLFLAGFAVSREMKASAQAWAEIDVLNAGLERRVEQRTQALQAEMDERRRTEESLHASQERFRLLLDGVKDYAIYMIDPQGLVISWNEGAARLKGYRSEEILGRNFSCFYLAEDREADKPACQLREALAKGRFEEQAQRVRKDGSIFWANVVITPMYDAAGTLRGFSKVACDITESRRVQNALRESEERFLAMANGIPQLAWMAEADGSIFWYNQRWYQYTGTTLEQMQGWEWQSVHDPQMLPQVLEEWKGAIAAARPFDMEFPLRGADGHFRMFLTRAMPLRDSEDRVVRWFGTNTDISERKQAAERLAGQAEELARRAKELREQAKVLDLAQVMVRDMAGRIVLWSKGCEQLYGYSREEAVGRASGELLRTAFPEPLPQIEETLLRTGRWEGELIHRRKDSGSVVVASVWVLHRDAQDRPFRIMEANTDITEREQAKAQLSLQADELARQAYELGRSQEALRTQTQLLQSALHSMEEGLVAADEQGRILLWNPAATKILGSSAKNISSSEWAKEYGLYLPDGETPYPAERLPLALAIGGKAANAEMIVRHPKVPESRWIEASARPTEGPNGAASGGVVAFRDITERKVAEQEIQKLNDELEQRVLQRTAQLQAANHELEAFTYSVSHDLRAPLRHIAGFAGILAEEFGPKLEPQAQHYLKRIADGTREMGQLVDELLGLARVGRQTLRLQLAGLDSIVSEAVALLKPEYERRTVEWKIAKLPFVECDPTLMKQVFQNLISNALKYSRPRPVAIVEIGQVETKEGETAVFVRDNGVGFSMKYADKLFGVFERLHRTEDFEGTGVGLATVQRIIQKHGGRVWAEAELDRGATFYFTLASAEQREEPKAAPAAQGARA